MDREFYEREITVRLFQTSNALQVLLDRILKAENLTAKQFFLMIIVGNFDYDPNIGEIAEAFKTSHQNVKKLLVKLQNQQFVELYKDPSDSRITRVTFTEFAKTFWENREAKDEQTMNQLYASIPLERMKVFRDALLQMLSTIEKIDE